MPLATLRYGCPRSYIVDRSYSVWYFPISLWSTPMLDEILWEFQPGLWCVELEEELVSALPSVAKGTERTPATQNQVRKIVKHLWASTSQGSLTTEAMCSGFAQMKERTRPAPSYISFGTQGKLVEHLREVLILRNQAGLWDQLRSLGYLEEIR